MSAAAEGDDQVRGLLRIDRAVAVAIGVEDLHAAVDEVAVDTVARGLILDVGDLMARLAGERSEELERDERLRLLSGGGVEEVDHAVVAGHRQEAAAGRVAVGLVLEQRDLGMDRLAQHPLRYLDRIAAR